MSRGIELPVAAAYQEQARREAAQRHQFMIEFHTRVAGDIFARLTSDRQYKTGIEDAAEKSITYASVLLKHYGMIVEIKQSPKKEALEDGRIDG